MYLFFDTETTGLPKKRKASVSDVDNWPRLVQLAWLIYDDNGREIASRNDIIYPDGFSIPHPAARVHGISTRQARREGIPVAESLAAFNKAINRVKYLVAHNMAFDEKVIGAELVRAQLNTRFFKKSKICTMQSSIKYCGIPRKRGGYKWPKLSELHMQLFGEDFDDAHDALADIQATARCYWKMRDLELV